VVDWQRSNLAYMAYMVVFAESGILLVDQGEDRPKYYGKRTENPIPYFHHFHHFHALSTQNTARQQVQCTPFPEAKAVLWTLWTQLLSFGTWRCPGGVQPCLVYRSSFRSPCMDPRNEAPQVTSLISSKSLLLPVVVGVYDLKL
jgi:hypothetical protein